MSKQCFVICPIGSDGSDIRKRSDQWCRHVVKPITDDCGYDMVRADDMPNPGIITNQIMDAILESPLLIADLTGGNPNVFYELALRHACRKPFIQMMEARERVPFDVHAVRTISYDLSDPDDLHTASTTLKRQIEAIDNGHAVDSPVTMAITTSLMSSAGDNAISVFLEKFWQIEADFESLHQSIDGLKDTTESLESDVSSIEIDVSDIKSDVSSIESNLSSVESEISDIGRNMKD